MARWLTSAKVLGVSRWTGVGFQSCFTAEHVFPEEDEEYSATLRALRYAHDKLELKPPFTAAPELAPRHDRYYLV